MAWLPGQIKKSNVHPELLQDRLQCKSGFRLGRDLSSRHDERQNTKGSNLKNKIKTDSRIYDPVGKDSSTRSVPEIKAFGF